MDNKFGLQNLLTYIKIKIKVMGKSLDEFEAIQNALKGASEFNLEVEVVWYALKYMKENPRLTIEEAINLGFKEWVK